jgi:hypothetical protein
MWTGVVVTLRGVQLRIAALEYVEGLVGRMRNLQSFYAGCSPSLGPCARYDLP